MIHVKKPPKWFDETLNLAHGTCVSKRDVGRKGIHRVFVPYNPGGENIDLFPEGYLIERGCNLVRGDENYLVTPKGKKHEIQTLLVFLGCTQ